MFLRKANSKWIVRTPAKLNVYLSVRHKRADGYHELQTLMVPIRLFDTLILEPLTPADSPSAEIQFQLIDARSAPQAPLKGPQAIESGVARVPSDATNLVVRSLLELRRRTACLQGARVRLYKRIPTGTGLGGGSSDAAAALLVANRAWGLHLPTPRLAEVAATLGSDIPFFLFRKAAICTGRGESVAPLPARTRLHLIVVSPRQRLSSADVYRAWDAMTQETPLPGPSRFAEAVDAFRRGDIGAIGRHLHNGLERAAFFLQPTLAQIKNRLSSLGDWKSGMSGSGSSFFCICRTARQAKRGAALINAQGLSLAMATTSYG